MNIRRMLPIGTRLRKCLICGEQITAYDDELTAHETDCLYKAWLLKYAESDDQEKK